MKKTGFFRGNTLISGTIEPRARGTSLPFPSLPFITYDRLGEPDPGATLVDKRLGRALDMITLVQEKRDNTRIQPCHLLMDRPHAERNNLSRNHDKA
jgi:hypothetical protein